MILIRIGIEALLESFWLLLEFLKLGVIIYKVINIR